MKALTAWFTLLILSLLMLPAMAGAAAPAIQLFMNGAALQPEVAPRIVNESTIVPIRIIAESLGSKVAWNEKSRKVTLTKDGTTIELVIDKKAASVNGKAFALEAAPVIVDGSTMLPIRFVSEQFGIEVKWDNLSRSVFLTKPADPPKTETAGGQAPKDPQKETQGEVQEDTQKENPSAGKDADIPAGESTAGEAVKAGDSPSSSKGGEGGQSAGPNKEQGSQPAEQVKEPGGKISVPQPGSSGALKPGAPLVPTKENGQNASAETEGGAVTGEGTVNPEDAQSTGEKEASGEIATIQSITLAGETLSIQSDGGEVKPGVFRLANPERLIVDLPGAVLGDSLTANLKGLKEGKLPLSGGTVTGVRYSLFSKEDSIVRIVIDLSQRSDLSLGKGSKPGEITGKIVPGKTRFRVVIDAGHGGKDSGAISLLKRKEKDYVLQQARKTADLLKTDSRFDVVMTRSDDTFIELGGRTDLANAAQADLFVSIHANTAGKESIRGTETYYYTEQSRDFAGIMHKHLLGATGFPDRKVKQERFYVIRNTRMPSVLLEVGFLSNAADEGQLYQDEFQNRVAASIAAAIKEQLNLD
ncbi:MULTISPECIES: N-acetylmuramoyl-L-alanine amidase [Paenibacillus]|uniref:N-acetylmuramoyl-L-alanine amidase n=1 Tax=Paenibacillus TaxID=44249 RepID=UPI0022B88655|nr:N-acetylmuramoyl-L-alanine amidase [Paenibacillus caseinilyticus]MCZ8521415.1 N-acetylmuramoyl-L-alanine amidase [Paenibacillus caseinilyticus]